MNISHKIVRKPNVSRKVSTKKPTHFYLRVLSRHPSTSD